MKEQQALTRTVLCAQFSIADVYTWAVKLQSRVLKDGATFQVLGSVVSRLKQGLEDGVMTEEFRTYGNIFTLIMSTEDTRCDLSSFAEHRLRCALGGITVKVEQQEQASTTPNRATQQVWNAYGGGLSNNGKVLGIV